MSKFKYQDPVYLFKEGKLIKGWIVDVSVRSNSTKYEFQSDDALSNHTITETEGVFESLSKSGYYNRVRMWSGFTFHSYIFLIILLMIGLLLGV